MVPYPILSFTLFGKQLGIHLYGVFIAIGIVGCLIVLYLYTGKKGMPTKLQDFIFFVALVAIALGFLFAKFFQAVYNWLANPKLGFNFANAGITAMGGIIGGAGTFLLVYFLVGKFYFNGKDKNLHIKQFNSLLGVAPCCITFAHACGRIGCLMAGCCHGYKMSDSYVFGSVVRYIYNKDTGVTKLAGYYMPVQLYEAIFLFALFALLSVLYFKHVNINFPVYLVGYAIFRFVIEFFRTDDRGSFSSLSPSQWQSFVFIVIAVIYVAIYLWRKIPIKGQLECELESQQTRDKKRKKN